MGQKRKLTKGQQRRMQVNQEKRLARRQEATDTTWSDASLGEPEFGRIVSRFGQHADVLTEEGLVVRCNIRRTVVALVTGDRVAWRRSGELEQGLQGVVEAVEPRESELCRPDIYDGLKPVAANVDQIFVVTSPQPAFSDQIIDRYLVACEDAGIEAVIVLNKVDLLTDEEATHVRERLKVYQEIGYRVVEVSAHTNTGIESLRSMFVDRISVFVGQSGVGKSSLIQAALPELELLIGAISEGSGLGQHTTTVARWYPLAGGGALIDSPGIREFGLWHLPVDKITEGFRDFHPYLGTCKFRDCTHRDDPGCALRTAAEEGELDAGRLANYHRIIDSLDKN
ncbi:MAG: small ribosomal subunit biogenesis GTPase RsgA [Idiomarina sp.]|nr:small ribosomal subunit biogenesis GTPase RsgA [Idiomarina sp.]